MNCGLVAKLIDVQEKVMEFDDGKKVEMSCLTVLDEDAFMDSDRFFSIWAKKEVIPPNIDSMLSKLVQFKGVLTHKWIKAKSQSELKFTPEHIQEVK